MQKTANVDWGEVLNFLLAGTALGGGAAVSEELLSSLYKKYLKHKQQQEEQKALEDPLSGEAIVLTIPKEASSAEQELLKRVIAKPKQKKTETNINAVKHPNNNTFRNPKDGTFEKNANWMTLALGIPSAVAAFPITYSLTKELLQEPKIREKEEELRRAKQEYLDMLAKAYAANTPKKKSKKEESKVDEKKEEEVMQEALGGNSEFGKVAFSVSDYVIGVPAAGILLGTLGSAYLTKKILDQWVDPFHKKYKIPEDEYKINTIYYKTEEDKDKDKGKEKDNKEETEKKAEDIKVAEDTFYAAMAIYDDIINCEVKNLANEKVAHELEKIGTDAATLYKYAAENPYVKPLFNILESNPTLRSTLKHLYLSSHPVLKYFDWAVDIPGISWLSDKIMYHSIGNMFKGSEFKAAQFTPIMHSAIGSTIAALIEHEKENKKNKEEKAKKDKSKLPEIKGLDPKAVKFIEENKDKIISAVKKLRSEGKI